MYARKRKEWEKHQRQNRIIDISQKIFVEQGYGGTTMDRIAKEAGYCKRTLYLYFKDKEDLFAAIVLKGLEKLEEKMEEAMETANNGLDKIHAMAWTYFRFWSEEPLSFKFMVMFDHKNRYYHRSTSLEEDSFFKMKCQRIFDRLADMAIKAIEDAMNVGAIKSSLSPLQLMLILWGELSGVMETIATRKGLLQDTYGITPEDIFLNFITMVEKSLGK